jgi:hypothetical protein
VPYALMGGIIGSADSWRKGEVVVAVGDREIWCGFGMRG